MHRFLELHGKESQNMLYRTTGYLKGPKFIKEARAARGLVPLAVQEEAAPLIETSSNSGETASSSGKTTLFKGALLCVIDNDVPTGVPNVKVVKLATNPIPEGRERDFDAYRSGSGPTSRMLLQDAC